MWIVTQTRTLLTLLPFRFIFSDENGFWWKWFLMKLVLMKLVFDESGFWRMWILMKNFFDQNGFDEFVLYLLASQLGVPDLFPPTPHRLLWRTAASEPHPAWLCRRGSQARPRGRVVNHPQRPPRGVLQLKLQELKILDADVGGHPGSGFSSDPRSKPVQTPLMSRKLHGGGHVRVVGHTSRKREGKRAAAQEEDPEILEWDGIPAIGPRCNRTNACSVDPNGATPCCGRTLPPSVLTRMTATLCGRKLGIRHQGGSRNVDPNWSLHSAAPSKWNPPWPCESDKTLWSATSGWRADYCHLPHPLRCLIPKVVLHSKLET